MGVPLPAEGFAEGDGVLFWPVRELRSLMVVVPEVKRIEKVKARRVSEAVAIGLVIGAEENGGSKDVLEGLDEAVVVAAVFGQVEKVEHLSGTGKRTGRLFWWTARVATQMVIRRSWPMVG